MIPTIETVQHKTCKITIVTPGQSDMVIKVYPAQHEAEKIWLNRAPGIQRWEAVQRLIQLHAERGRPVPKPAAYHEGGDLRTVVLREDQIPVVRLDGHVLQALPEADASAPVVPAAPTADQRLARLEAVVLSMAGQSRETPAILSSTEKSTCDVCENSPKTTDALRKREISSHKRDRP